MKLPVNILYLLEDVRASLRHVRTVAPNLNGYSVRENLIDRLDYFLMRAQSITLKPDDEIAQMIAVMEEAAAGKPIEVKGRRSKVWNYTDAPRWNWAEFEYRVMDAPLELKVSVDEQTGLAKVLSPAEALVAPRTYTYIRKDD